MLKRLAVVATAAFIATTQIQFAAAAPVSNGAAALKATAESFSAVTPTWYYRRCCGPYFYRPYDRPYYDYRPRYRPYYSDYYPPPHYYRPYYRPYYERPWRPRYYSYYRPYRYW